MIRARQLKRRLKASKARSNMSLSVMAEELFGVSGGSPGMELLHAFTIPLLWLARYFRGV